MSRPLLLATTALMLASCSSMYYDFHQEPLPVHDSSVQKSQTAVFSVMETTTVPANGIARVDGTELNCAKAGCPMWVRVAAGNHKFVVRRRVFNGTWYRDAEFEVSVKNMLRKHVYLVNMTSQGDSVAHETKDLGESPDYGISIGKGKDRQYHRVSF